MKGIYSSFGFCPKGRVDPAVVQAGRETGREAVSYQLPMGYRQIGQALASHINQSSGVTTGAALQGMIADQAADHPELLLPMRDLVSRPAFQSLIAKADSGSGMLQHDALINEVRPLSVSQKPSASSWSSFPPAPRPGCIRTGLTSRQG